MKTIRRSPPAPATLRRLLLWGWVAIVAASCGTGGSTEDTHTAADVVDARDMWVPDGEPPDTFVSEVAQDVADSVEVPEVADTPDGEDVACPDGDCPDAGCTQASCEAQIAPEACQRVSCNGETGACELETVPDGTGCDDGDGCTEHDFCDGGLCGGEPKRCETTEVCAPASCEVETGDCVTNPRPEGEACGEVTADGCHQAMCRAGVCGAPEALPDGTG